MSVNFWPVSFDGCDTENFEVVLEFELYPIRKVVAVYGEIYQVESEFCVNLHLCVVSDVDAIPIPRVLGVEYFRAVP